MGTIASQEKSIYYFITSILAALSIFLYCQQLAFANTSPAKPSQVVSQKSDQYAPKINPHPKYFLTVQGKVDPQLVGKLKLKFIGQYATTDEKCDKTYNWFEGVYGWRTKKLSYIATPSNSGEYQLKIPLDHFYSGGICNWSIIAIDDCTKTSTSASNIDLCNTVMQFYPCGTSSSCTKIVESKKSQYHLNAHQNYICRYKKNNELSCEPKNSTSFNAQLNVPRNNNYILYKNYKLIEG